ncbi:microtubule associated protein 1S [Echinococcus multilocularis]|uniref:Microtubule associated protein 1S n=1 Tax=Echinococcus multilocularis TaxID=6211 RepID=A0A068XZZ3_ECHMU|nr:microtubule associated protein 1S [Echinococcus multilocularis]
MAFVTVLGVFGSNGTENKTDKFQKLFYDGLVMALGIYASDVDAVVATSAPAPALTKTKKYGTALIHPLSSGTPLRALFQPELHQFQTAFEEAVAEAVDAVGSGVAVVVVVYAGEVLHSTGEWLLADTTFSGEQLQMWLDSSAAAAWQPDIQKLTTAPSGTEPINIVVCTPSAGAKTRWPMAAIPGGSTQLVMLSKSRRLPVHLQTMASWRANGKLPAAPSNATAFEALHALSGELARLHWDHQLKLLAEAEQEFTLAQRAFKHAPPALYLLPSGHGGVQTQACGLFVVQGVNVLLGSAFAEHKPPQWWQLVRSLDRLDTAIFPDWSAASIQSYRFLTKHLLYATSASYSANWLGCLFTPAPIEPGGESPLLLTPPTTATTTADPHRLRYLSAQPEQTRLFYKIGVGELSLKYLGASVGVLLVWHPAPGEGKAKTASPLTIFLPVVHSPEASVSPASLLAGLVRMLRKAPETNVEGANAITTATPTKRTTLASTAAKSSGVASRTVNSTPPMKTHVNGTLRNSTLASTKPPASQSTPTRTLPSRTPMTRPVAPSRTMSSTTPRTKTTTTTPRPATSTTRPTTTTITTPRDRAAHPTTTRPSTAGIKAKITPFSKKSLDEKRLAPTSKTEVKLVEHAAKVAKATAEKTGHEIKYAPSGRPSNLPPRRKVGEKTVMEELNELPEVMKTPATDSLAEVVKLQQQGQETEEEVSYPDSLHAEETETKEAVMTPNKAEPAKYVVSAEHHEVPEAEPVPASHEEISKSPASLDFAVPAVTDNHDVITPKADDSKSPMGAGLGVEQHQEDLGVSLGSPIESTIGKSPAGMDLAMSSACAEHHKDLEMEVSTSSVDKGLVFDSGADEHHEEFVMSKSLAAMVTLKSPTGMEFTMPPGVDENHEDLHAHEVGSKSPFHEEVFEPKSSFHDEISKSSAGMKFEMPPGFYEHHEDSEILKSPADIRVSTFSADTHLTKQSGPKHQEEFRVLHSSGSKSECPIHEEILKSSTDVGFAMPADVKVPTSPADVEYGVHHDGEHEEDLEESRSALHEEISKSPTDVGFAMPADVKVPTSAADVEYGVHHDGEHEEDLEESRSALHEEILKSSTDVGFAMPADVKVPTSPADVEYGVHHDGEHEEDLEESRSALHEEILKSSTDVGFAMPADVKVPTSAADVEYGVHHDGGHEEDLEESRSALHEEISKSPTDVGFAMPADVKVPTSAADVEYGVHHDGEHEEDLEESRSALHEEISKSPTDVGFAMPADVKVPTSAADVEYGVHHDGEHEEDLEESRSALHEEISKSPTDVGFAMPADVKVPTSAADVEYGVHHDGEHEEDLEESRSALHEEISKSPTDVGFAMPADVKVPTSAADVEYGAHHDGEHEEDLEESRSALHEESSQSSVGMELGVQHEFYDSSGLPRSPDKAQFALSPDTGAHKDVEIAQSPVIVDFDNTKKHQPVESYISRSQAHFERKVSKSPAGMEFAVPSGDATCCEVVDASKTSIAESTLLSRSPELNGSLKSNFPPSSLGDHTMEVPKFQEQSHAQPQTATTDDEFPVHEISVGGGTVIPEVTDHIDSTESTPENMPLIHGDLMYRLQTECTSQPADSTTYDEPHIGFMDVAAGRPVDENIHTPSSEASNGSMIPTEAAPIPPGFKPEVVSSFSPTINVASPQSGAPSGFSSQHPLLYSQHQSESFEGEEEAEASFHQKFHTATVGGTGDVEVPSCKEVESSEKPIGSSDSSGAVFDLLTQWGHPQGIPVPVLPSRTILVRPSRPTTARLAAPGTKAPASPTTSKAPETLSPGYIIRVPFAMATQFFTQVRARVYVLSGECLHPITGEALIAGISKWKPEEREAVIKMSGGRGVKGINVVPTDEPLEWVRWLRRSSGGSGDGSGTGEERLQAVGVTVHSSATLSDIHFSDHGTEITCPAILHHSHYHYTSPITTFLHNSKRLHRCLPL